MFTMRQFRAVILAISALIAAPAIAADAVELEFWRSVQAGGTQADYRAYLDRYPNGDFAQIARNRLGAPAPKAAASVDERSFLSRRDRLEAQRALTRAGYDTRGIDGSFGPGTRRAIRGWQTAEGFAATGFLTQAQFNRLTGGAPAATIVVNTRVADDRAWNNAVSRGTPAAYRSYLDRFPRGAHAAKARRRLDNRDRVADFRFREDSLGMNRAQREEVEFRLSRAGFFPGSINGRFDRDTRQAIRNYRRSRGMRVHAYVDRPMLTQLVRDTGGSPRRSRGEDGNDLAIGIAAGALVLGGIILLAD